MSKILTQQEAKETGLDGHAIVGKLIPVLAPEQLAYMSPRALSLLLWAPTSGGHGTTGKAERQPRPVASVLMGTRGLGSTSGSLSCLCKHSLLF